MAAAWHCLVPNGLGSKTYIFSQVKWCKYRVYEYMSMIIISWKWKNMYSKFHHTSYTIVSFKHLKLWNVYQCQTQSWETSAMCIRLQRWTYYSVCRLYLLFLRWYPHVCTVAHQVFCSSTVFNCCRKIRHLCCVNLNFHSHRLRGRLRFLWIIPWESRNSTRFFAIRNSVNIHVLFASGISGFPYVSSTMGVPQKSWCINVYNGT